MTRVTTGLEESILSDSIEEGDEQTTGSMLEPDEGEEYSDDETPAAEDLQVLSPHIEGRMRDRGAETIMGVKNLSLEREDSEDKKFETKAKMRKAYGTIGSRSLGMTSIHGGRGSERGDEKGSFYENREVCGRGSSRSWARKILLRGWLYMSQWCCFEEGFRVLDGVRYTAHF